jgi:hypothetical protein
MTATGQKPCELYMPQGFVFRQNLNSVILSGGHTPESKDPDEA